MKTKRKSKIVNMKYIKTDKESKTPEYKSEEAAGADMYSIEEVVIKPSELVMIKTGIATEIPDGYFGMLAPRASFCLKLHLDMPHSVGIIDSDYRGEILVPLRNLGKEKVVIAKGERIAQLIIIPYLKVKYVESKKLNTTVRGKGGFGSTGKF